MTTSDNSEFGPEGGVLYDDGLAQFSLNTWRLSVNEDQAALVQLVTAPVLPNDAKRFSVLAHEYHHWVSTFCSTYGLLVNIFRQQAANEAVTLANVLAGTSELQKPVIASLRTGIQNCRTQKDIEQLISTYTTEREFVALLIGTKQSPYARFCELLPELLPLFQRIKNAIPLYANGPRNITDLRHRWTTGRNLNATQPDEEFLALIRSTCGSLTREQHAGLDLHLQLDSHERLNWPAFLEGHAKYFQRAFESYVIGVTAGDNEGQWHEAMHGTKDYEAWNSPYSRLRRVMVTIMGRDPKYCECCEIITLLALADLAINPSLHEDYFFPEEKGVTMQTFFPGQRFAWACVAAKQTKSIAQRLESNRIDADSLETAYMEFMSDCCSYLKWEPPWIQSRRWLDRYPECPDGNGTGFLPLDYFLEGCRLRLDHPLFFGVPSHAVKRVDNKELYWPMLLAQYLTIPNFASRDSFPCLHLGGKHKSPILRQQLYAIEYDILDQLMLCSGPLRWDAIMATLGKSEYANMVLDMVKRELRSHGVDLNKVVHQL